MNYYDSQDLGKFADVGKFRRELMDKFFAYYREVTGEDGALSKREKALIALAVAHSKKCPYCIDAYTKDGLEKGCDPEQLTEVVHVAAAIKGGAALVHGVQMRNVVDDVGM